MCSSDLSCLRSLSLSLYLSRLRSLSISLSLLLSHTSLLSSLLTTPRLTSSDPCTSHSLTHLSFANGCCMCAGTLFGGSLFSGVCAWRLVQWRQTALEYPCVGFWAGQVPAPPSTKLSRQLYVGHTLLWRRLPRHHTIPLTSPFETHPTL